MKYRITHATTYRYSQPVTACDNQVHLALRPVHWQAGGWTEIDIQPAPDTRHTFNDYFGNPVTAFSIYEPHDSLIITARSHVTVDIRPPVQFDRSPAWEQVRGELADTRDLDGLDAYQFTFASSFAPRSEALAAFARECFGPRRSMLGATMALCQKIHDEFRYDPTATEVTTSAGQVLDARHGVCQDFAHLMIAALRSLGLAACYVSGYLRTGPLDGQPRLVGADASHAWVSVFCPEHGWVDFDPTNACIAGIDHITLAWGRDYGDVAPVRGVVLGGGIHELDVAVDVSPE